MKKILMTLSLSIMISSAFAKTCPPASALHHPVIGQNWVLDDQYKIEGWQVGEDYTPVKQNPFKALPANTIITVLLRPNEYWKATCYYIVPGKLPSNQDKITVSTTQLFDERKIPQPPFVYFQASDEWEYICYANNGPGECTYPDKKISQLIKVN